MTGFDELVAPTSLGAAFGDVRRRSPSAGSDGITPTAYERHLEAWLDRLSRTLRAGAWRPAPLVRLRQRKPGGGVRRLAIPTVEDRIVIEVLRRALEPIIEPRLSVAAYAYRPGRSARGAVEVVARCIEEGAGWVALADVRDFFDTIGHAQLAKELDGLGCEARVRALLDRLLAGHATRPGRGLAQGSAISPLLSNLVLAPVDRALLEDGHRLVRYCDNLCVPTRSRAAASRALAAVRRELGRRGLSLKPEASRVAEVREGFTWLGFWLGSTGRRVSDSAVRALRARLDAAGEGKTGLALRERLRPIVRGWAQYFDVALPEGASLGRYDDAARSLLMELRGGEAMGPQDAAPEAERDERDEDWDERELEADGEQDGSRRRAVDELLAEADRLAARGAYAEAERAQEEAERLAAAPLDEVVDAPDQLEADQEAVDAYLGLFCAGQDEHEAAPVSGRAGPRELVRVERPPGATDVRAHLLGQTALAVRPRLADGGATLGVLDVDGTHVGTEVAVRAHVDALCSVARSWGLQVLVERTGGRGMHVWIPFEGRVRAHDVAALLARLVAAAGWPADGVRVERLPGGDGEPDLHAQSITLPLGLHVETGARSRLAWGDGREVGNDLCGVFAGAANDPARIVEVSGSSEGARTEVPVVAVVPAERLGQGVAVQRVMAGCAVLRHLADKAAAVGHLDHAERLSLLYSLGHLGEAGRRAIHEIVGRCGNYDEAETSRQIGRLSGLPISCTRMREKHVTAELAPLCACEFGDVRRRGGYPTPLLHAAGFRRVWRDELRGRRLAEVVARERPPEGVAAVAERSELPRAVAPGDDDDGDRAAGGAVEPALDGRGVVVAGVAPHEWA